MKKSLLIIVLILTLAIPNHAHANFFTNLFSKKSTTIEQKNNNSINSKVSNSTNIGATTVEGVKNTVNLPDNQKSQLFNGNLFETFNPAFIKQNELNQQEIDTIKALIDNQNINNKSLLDKANTISESAIKNGKENTDSLIKGNSANADTITKPLNDISGTLKDPPALKLHSETQSFIQSLRQDLITPLQNIASKIELVGSQLTTNNTALISAITNMPFPSAGGGSGTSLTSSSITQTAHGFVVGDWLYFNGTQWAKADADASYAASQAIGVIETGNVIDANSFKITYDGLITITGATYAPLTVGSNYYLSTTAGQATPTAVSGIFKALFTATSTTGGYIVQGQGQTAVVDYVNATLPSTSVVANSATPFVTQSGNITNTSGVFSLSAGKSYKLQAFLSSGNISGSAIRFQWRNVTSGLLIGNQGTTFAPTNGGAEGDSSYAEVILTPTVNTTVQLEATGSISATTGSLTIVQIGASAYTTLNAFTGATSLVAGAAGGVPAPVALDNSKLLTGDGTWGSSLIGTRVLTSGTSYTPTAGTNKIIAYVIGGGAGGGSVASSISTLSGSGGGAGGVVGFTEDVSDQIVYTYSIGLGGASSTNGGTSSIVVNGNTYTATGGTGGVDGTSAAPSVTGGAIGGTTTPASVSGNVFYAANGGPGATAYSIAPNNHASGSGGSNMFGTGGRSLGLNAAGSSIGVAGDGFGGGGSGALQNNTTARAGGAGFDGAIVITEIR